MRLVLISSSQYAPLGVVVAMVCLHMIRTLISVHFHLQKSPSRHQNSARDAESTLNEFSCSTIGSTSGTDIPVSIASAVIERAPQQFRLISTPTTLYRSRPPRRVSPAAAARYTRHTSRQLRFQTVDLIKLGIHDFSISVNPVSLRCGPDVPESQHSRNRLYRRQSTVFPGFISRPRPNLAWVWDAAASFAPPGSVSWPTREDISTRCTWLSPRLQSHLAPPTSHLSICAVWTQRSWVLARRQQASSISWGLGPGDHPRVYHTLAVCFD
jgi:hypothetical protein